MTTPDNKKTALIYEGPIEPELSENPNIPSPLWRDTSGETPVLKMHNADHSAWVPIASEFANKLEDDVALTFGTDDDATIKYDEAGQNQLEIECSSIQISGDTGVTIDATDGDIFLSAVGEGKAITSSTTDGHNSVFANGTGVAYIYGEGGVDLGTGQDVNITIAASGTGVVDIDGAGGVTIDAGTDTNVAIGITGVGYADLFSDQAYLDVRNSGIELSAIDGTITLFAANQTGTPSTVNISGSDGVAIATTDGNITIGANGDGHYTTVGQLNIGTTHDAGLFHVGAMPATGRAGQVVVDSGDSYKMKICTVAGTPGTWVVVGTQA